MKAFLSKIFGTKNDRVLKEFRPKIEKINSLEDKIQSFSDYELRNHNQVHN